MSTLNSTDLDRLASELASFAHSDVPMPEGLAQLQANLSGGKLKVLSGELASATNQGTPLSDALKGASVQVPPSFAALVQCGEISGDMTGVLDFALENGRRLRRHRASVSTLFIYPILVMLVMLTIIGFTAIFIVPKFKDIYDQLGAELPAPTQLIVEISWFLGNYGFLVYLVLAALLIYFILAALTERLPERMLNILPGVSRLVYLSDTAIMTEFIGHLLNRGVPLPDACRAASLVVSQQDMTESLEQMATAADKGGASWQELNPSVPATAAWLYRQGESRGSLSETCFGIARYCEGRFELLSRRSLYVMEPMFILTISLLAGFFIIALYLPLFNIPKILGR